MMQAEKVAGDLREATSGGGPGSPVPALSALVRRLERRGAQAPALVEPAVKALDAALTALDDARGHLEAALRAPNSIRANSSASRSGCSRCAPRAQVHVAGGRSAALAARYAADLSLIDAGEERLAALERQARDEAARYDEAASALSSGARKAPTEARQGGQRRAQAAEARTRASRRRSTSDRPPRARTASTGSSSGCRPIPARGRAR
jgi:DNA repair protein RecN (Recombination protein N)